MRFSRRRLLAASSAYLGYCAGAGKAQAERPPNMRTLYIAPHGSGDGSSWETPAPFADIGYLTTRVIPGGEVLLAANRGLYTPDHVIEFYRGGAAAAPITIRGVNSTSGAPMAAVIRANRAGAVSGREAFRLLRGADHLRFSHFHFQDVGNGCFRVAGALTGLTIEDCTFENIYRFLENTVTGAETDATFRQFAVRRCTGTRAERGFLRIRYGSSDGVIEHCTASGRANQGGVLPSGCALEDHARDIVYRNCVMQNFQQWRAGSYWNGDGFSDEAQNAGIRYENCEARGSTDGGFDCKSQDVALVNCISQDNKRNFRIWSARATLTGCTSRAPNFRGRGIESADSCHVWIGGELRPALVRMVNFTVADSDGSTIFDIVNDQARVELSGVTLNSPRPNWGDARNRRMSGDTMLIAPH